MRCKICSWSGNFITTENPPGYLVCCTCGYRFSKSGDKMVKTNFGYKFVDKHGKDIIKMEYKNGTKSK